MYNSWKQKFIKTFKRKEFSKTIVVKVHTDKGGIGKSTIATQIAQAFSLRDKETTVVIVTADVNECLLKYLNEEFCKKQLGRKLNLKLIAIENADKKSKNQINQEIKSKLLADERLESFLEKNEESLTEDELENTFFLEDKGEIKPVDMIIYDIAGGIDQIETDEVKQDSIDHFITVANANSAKSKQRAFVSILKTIKAEDEALKAAIAESGDDYADYSADEIAEIKQEQGITYKYAYIHRDTRGCKKDFSKTKQELREVEKEYNVKIQLIYVPRMNFEVFEEAGVSYFITRYELEQKGICFHTMKLIEERQDMTVAVKQLLKNIA
ncbi:ArsA-related P-loop ATPase [Vibrio jasicida]|uniref:ArsA-related P-loop ATPase n=1 Tax=Vibrio jasicida TaxID=766224 RepID=UPI0005EE42CA|nr:ArsA-related P-loop ATPase [Vibrio jasicida]